MKQDHLSKFKEIRPHGTKTFPCSIYQTRATGKGTLVKHHWHDEVEILFFLDGDFRLDINMETFEIHSRCFYFINPGELHSIVTEKAGSPGEDAVVFHMDILSFENYDATQSELIHPIRQGQLLFPRCLTPEHPAFPAIYQAFYEIMHSFDQKPSEENPIEDGAVANDLTSQLVIKTSLLRILASLSRYHLFQFSEKDSDKRVECLKATITYIREYYKEKIYISDLASQAGMNEQYFCRFFKKAIGRSPMEYVNEYRIKQAIRLLEDTEESVTAVCLDSGFNNLGNFMREFKKCTGYTPLQYRKKSK